MSYETYFRSLYEVTRVINSSLDPEQVLASIAQQAVDATGAKGCTLRLLNRSGDVLKASASFGLSRKYLRKGPIEVAKSAVDKEVLAGRTVYIENVCCDARFQYPEAAQEEGITSALILPLRVEGRPIGVLRVYTEKKHAFEGAEREFLTALADLSALAIENARLHQALRVSYENLSNFEYRIFED